MFVGAIIEGASGVAIGRSIDMQRHVDAIKNFNSMTEISNETFCGHDAITTGNTHGARHRCLEKQPQWADC